MRVKEIDWSVLDRRTVATRNGFVAYSVTKLMNILHAKALAHRLAGTSVTTSSLHPGGVASNIWRRVPQPVQWLMKLFLDSNEKGAETPLYCATAPELRRRQRPLLRSLPRDPAQPTGGDASRWLTSCGTEPNAR